MSILCDELRYIYRLYLKPWGFWSVSPVIMHHSAKSKVSSATDVVIVGIRSSQTPAEE